MKGKALDINLLIMIKKMHQEICILTPFKFRQLQIICNLYIFILQHMVQILCLQLALQIKTQTT
jgi:hypothetical protein